MNDGTDPLELFWRFAQPAVPSVEEERTALARLQEAIDTETALPTNRRQRWVRVVPALAALGLVVALVAALLVARPGPAVAALAEIARAARQAEPLDVPDGSFIYRQSEALNLVVRPGSDLGLDRPFVAYLLPTRQETWRQPATRFYRAATTIGTPRFFDDQVATAYQANNGSALDRVGETIIEQFVDAIDPVLETDWPIEPTALRQEMESQLAEGADGRLLEVQLFDLAADILRDNVDSHLRAAVLEVLADLPIDVLDRYGDGAVTIAITYQTHLTTRDTLTITSDGILLSESTVWLDSNPGLETPAVTAITKITYKPPRIVSQLPTS